MADHKTLKYYTGLGKQLVAMARAMEQAIATNRDDPNVIVVLPGRVSHYIDFVKNTVFPALSGKVALVRVYRYGVVDPVIERTIFDYQELVNYAKSLNSNYEVDYAGVIYNSRNGKSVAYIEVWALNEQGDPVNITERLLDRLTDIG